MRVGFLRRVRVWGVAALVALSACASPTLPLPPPGQPTFEGETSTDRPTLLHLWGANAEPNATIVIVNLSGRVPNNQAVSGAIVAQDGTWDAYTLAYKRDVLEITQQIGTTRSPPTTVQVP